MFVCNCHCIRESDIHAQRDQGVCKTMDLFRNIGVGRPQCGKCVAMTRAILDGNDAAACDHRYCIKPCKR